MASDQQFNRLRDAYGEARLSRRQFVQGALALGLSTSGAAVLLTSCHSKKKLAAPPKRLSGRVQILVGFNGGNSAAERQVEQVLAQTFIQAHPQVGIDIVRAASSATAETQLTTLIGRGSPPDVVLGIGQGALSRLVDRSTWLDLRPLLDRDGITLDRFMTETRAAASLTSYYGSTSKTVAGIPVGVHDHALAYNVDLFTRAGLAPPPDSWSDASWTVEGTFLTAAQTLTRDVGGRHPGQAGFDANRITQFGIARLRPQQIFYALGGHAYDARTRRALFSAAPSVAGAQLASDLVNRHHVQPSPAQLAKLGPTAETGIEERTAWRAGKLAMIDLCSCEINTPFGSQVPFRWKAGALPATPTGRLGSREIDLGAIVAASKSHDLAWEFLKFLAVDPVNEGEFAYQGLGAIPAMSTNVDAFVQGVAQTPGVDARPWIAGLESSSSENDAWIPAMAEVQTLMTAALDQVVGGSPASEVMPLLQQHAQAKIDAWFQTHKLPH